MYTLLVLIDCKAFFISDFFTCQGMSCSNFHNLLFLEEELHLNNIFHQNTDKEFKEIICFHLARHTIYFCLDTLGYVNSTVVLIR